MIFRNSSLHQKTRLPINKKQIVFVLQFQNYLLLKPYGIITQNAIELLRRGYDVYIGQVNSFEVNFMAQDKGEQYIIRSL